MGYMNTQYAKEKIDGQICPPLVCLGLRSSYLYKSINSLDVPPLHYPKSVTTAPSSSAGMAYQNSMGNIYSFVNFKNPSAGSKPENSDSIESSYGLPIRTMSNRSSSEYNKTWDPSFYNFKNNMNGDQPGFSRNPSLLKKMVPFILFMVLFIFPLIFGWKK